MLPTIALTVLLILFGRSLAPWQTFASIGLVATFSYLSMACTPSVYAAFISAQSLLLCAVVILTKRMLPYRNNVMWRCNLLGNELMFAVASVA